MSSFVDKIRVSIKAGDGGNGAVSFHRERYVAAGGPDGGDGGRGGNIVFIADDNLSTLLDFRYKRRYEADNGIAGSKNNQTGKSASDLIIRVPRGTIVRDYESNGIIADISSDEPTVIAKGGKGGFGNAHFASPTRQIPLFAKTGQQGQKFDIVLELKLIADVGLVGFPNVGKSTLLAAVSRANPKIANYHFTTLIPLLGLVSLGQERSFVMADIPGLIEGASKGVGLGYDFLRHVDRCRMLLHVVDISAIEGRDPIDDFNIITNELKSFNKDLAARPLIVAGNKTDIADSNVENRFKEFIEKQGIKYFSISAATGKGIDILLNNIYTDLINLPPTVVYEPDYEKPKPKESNRFIIEREDDHFYIYAVWLEKILHTTNVKDYESLQYFQRVITDSGIVNQLIEMGVKQDDTIHIGEYQFDYIE